MHAQLRSELHKKLRNLDERRRAAQDIVLRRWLHPTDPMASVGASLETALSHQRDLEKLWAAASSEFQTLRSKIMVQFDHRNFLYGRGRR